jgi:hypothetical protein
VWLIVELEENEGLVFFEEETEVVVKEKVRGMFGKDLGMFEGMEVGLGFGNVTQSVCQRLHSNAVRYQLVKIILQK